MDKYIVIIRDVAHEIGIDWFTVCGASLSYEEAIEEFNKAKETLPHSESDCSKVIVVDRENLFHVRYDKPGTCPVHRYIKILNLY